MIVFSGRDGYKWSRSTRPGPVATLSTAASSGQPVTRPAARLTNERGALLDLSSRAPLSHGSRAPSSAAPTPRPPQPRGPQPRGPSAPERQKPGSTPPLPLGFGLGEVDEEGVTDGDGEAPFWTKMITFEPLAAVPLAGCWEKTVPFAYWAGPDPCWAVTANPAAVRIWLAVCWESPTTDGTGTDPPETVRVTVEPGGAVPPLGLWLTTVPEAAVEVASGLTETWKPLAPSGFWAAFSGCPTTTGRWTGAAPVETYSVTRVFAATLLPCAGLELITRPLPMLLLAWSITVERRCC